MKKLRHVPTGVEGEFVMTFVDIEGVEHTRIDHSFAGDKYAWIKPSSEFETITEDEFPHRDTSVPINYTEPTKPFYKNPFFWAILILFVAVVFLAYGNRNLKNQIESAEINKRMTETQRQIDSIEYEKTRLSSKITTNSEDNATRANNLVKSIKNEKPIIADTTHAAMYEYVKNYRPE